MPRLRVVMLAAAALAAASLTVPQSALACAPGDANCVQDNTSASSTQTGPSSGKVTAAAAGQQAVNVAVDLGNGKSTAATEAIPARVLPPCYYQQGMSGADLAAWLADPQTAKSLQDAQATGHTVTLPAAADIAAHATEDGYWYGMTCSSETFGDDFAAFNAYVATWLAEHSAPDVWVAAGTPAPEVPVPVEFLEAVAREVLNQVVAMPTIHFNPQERTFVNLATWMWVDPGAWTPISVTASANGNSVTVAAKPDALSVTGLPDGSTTRTTCAQGGHAYAAGATDADTDCWIRFGASSGGQPGQQWTFTTSLTWDVAATGAPLTGTPTLTTSSDQALTVLEVQTVNGR